MNAANGQYIAKNKLRLPLKPDSSECHSKMGEGTTSKAAEVPQALTQVGGRSLPCRQQQRCYKHKHNRRALPPKAESSGALRHKHEETSMQAATKVL